MTPARDGIARLLMIGLGIASVGAFANAMNDFAGIAPDRINIETWRAFGFLVFGGLYALLAFFPRRMPGVWELVFFHKVVVSLFLTYAVNPVATAATPLADTASAIILVDTILAVTTLFSYLLTAGWRAWTAPEI